MGCEGGGEAGWLKPSSITAGMGENPTLMRPPPARQVWNPSFDVAPASLITGIITERGLIPKV